MAWPPAHPVTAQAWRQRPDSCAAGCKRKFDIEGYVRKVDKAIKGVRLLAPAPRWHQVALTLLCTTRMPLE